MRIAEAAKLLERSPDTLKRYEDRGFIPEPTRDFQGWRVYTTEDIETIRAILSGQEKPVAV